MARQRPRRSSSAGSTAAAALGFVRGFDLAKVEGSAQTNEGGQMVLADEVLNTQRQQQFMA